MNRSNILDLLKGFAIIAVMLYHAGVLTYGYLGVEVFLVIAGYLTTKGILKQHDGNGFSYIGFIEKRLLRLWPLALIVSVMALAIGYFVMLPDSYKNCCETVVGTSWFLNNFVQYITSGNYWDTINEVKPLMHTWYLGIMMQYYLLFPILIMLVHKCSKSISFKRNVRWMLIAVTLVSLGIYLCPEVTDANRFYLLPTRMFEFALGGLLAVHVGSKSDGDHKHLRWGGFLLLAIVLLLMVINADMSIKQARLLTIVVVTLGLVVLATRKQFDCNMKVISFCGMASYSLYLWHEPQVEIEDMLEEVLINGKYKEKKTVVKMNIDFSSHWKFIDEMSMKREYFDISRIDYPLKGKMKFMFIGYYYGTRPGSITNMIISKFLKLLGK